MDQLYVQITPMGKWHVPLDDRGLMFCGRRGQVVVEWKRNATPARICARCERWEAYRPH